MKQHLRPNFLVITLVLACLSVLTYSTTLLAIPIAAGDLPKPGDMILISDKDIPLHINIAGKYLEKGKFNEVIAICERILQMKDNHIEALAHMAAAQNSLGEKEIFEKTSKRIHQIDPDSPALYLSMAVACRYDKDFECAELSYEKGLKVIPKKEKLLMGLANLYLENGQLDKASDQFERVLRIKGLPPKYFLNANFALCKIGLDQQNYSDVITRAKLVTDLYPVIPQGYQFLGSAYKAKGEINQAIKTYEKLININSNSPASFQELALIYNDIKNQGKALQYAEEGVKKFPEDAKSKDVLGWVYYTEEKYPEALKQFQVAVRMGQNNPHYLYHLGLVYMKLEKKSKAKEAFIQALNMLGPNGPKKFANEIEDKIALCK